MESLEVTPLKAQIRVGIMTFVSACCLFAGIIFAGGDKALLFSKTSELTARLPDVSGLKNGASVTLGGMTVGKVTGIRFAGGGETSIEVTLEIREDIRERLKADAQPSVRTQGIMGDRYLNLSQGSAEAPPLAPGAVLTGKKTSDFDDALDQATRLLKETNKTLQAVNERKGSAGELLYDQKFYQGLTEVTDNLNALLKDIKENPRRYIKLAVF